LQLLHGLPGPQITTLFCDASETMTVGELVVSGRAASGAADVALTWFGVLAGGAAHAVAAMHTIANELK
jgi:hypothetical protein